MFLFRKRVWQALEPAQGQRKFAEGCSLEFYVIYYCVTRGMPAQTSAWLAQLNSRYDLLPLNASAHLKALRKRYTLVAGTIFEACDAVADTEDWEGEIEKDYIIHM